MCGVHINDDARLHLTIQGRLTFLRSEIVLEIHSRSEIVSTYGSNTIAHWWAIYNSLRPDAVGFFSCICWRSTCVISLFASYNCYVSSRFLVWNSSCLRTSGSSTGFGWHYSLLDLAYWYLDGLVYDCCTFISNSLNYLSASGRMFMLVANWSRCACK